MAKEQDPKTVPERSLRASSNFFLTLYFGFKIAPSLGGILALYLGYRLFILGVTGQASLTVNSKSVGGQLLNAAPGLFFAVGGIVVMVAVLLKGVNLEMNTLIATPEDSARSMNLAGTPEAEVAEAQT